jgi:Heterokaryon incompatibility protein (HET)
VSFSPARKEGVGKAIEGRTRQPSVANDAQSSSMAAVAAPKLRAPRKELYRYESFMNDQSIRILKLRHGSGDQPLSGSLEFVNIHDAPEYEAISYVWGDPFRVAEIEIDGMPLALTQSLHDALKRLRHPDQPRRLWADQVCINQDDVIERGQQVRFMNQIYKNAARALVWLGKDDEGIALQATRFVRDLKDVLDDPTKAEQFRLAHSEQLHERAEEPWEPLKKLTRLPWVCTLIGSALSRC